MARIFAIGRNGREFDNKLVSVEANSLRGIFVMVLFIYIAERMIENWLLGFFSIGITSIYLTLRFFMKIEGNEEFSWHSTQVALTLLIVATLLYRSQKGHRLMFLQVYYNRETVDSFNHFLKAFPEGIIIFEGRRIVYHNDLVLDIMGLEHH